jgi:fucose permease
MAACLIFGFGVGPVFPLMLHDAPRRVGGAASGGIIGITIAANFTGAAVLPTLIGYVAARASISVLGPALVAFAIAVAAAHEFSARNSIS